MLFTLRHAVIAAAVAFTFLCCDSKNEALSSLRDETSHEKLSANPALLSVSPIDTKSYQQCLID